MNAKLLLALVVGGGLVYLGYKSGRITFLGASNERYYGGGGRCYRLSDDKEVDAHYCTDRGEDIGVDPFTVSGAVDAVSSAASDAASSIGGLFDDWLGGKEDVA